MCAGAPALGMIELGAESRCQAWSISRAPSSLSDVSITA